MTNNYRPYVILTIVALGLYFLFSYLLREIIPHDWTETYQEESKEPYGTFVTYELLKDFFPDDRLRNIKEKIEKQLPLEQEKKSNYVFVGEAMYFDSSDVKALLGYVEEGNTAFLSSKTLPFDLMFDLYFEECNDYYWDDYTVYEDTMTSMYLDHPNLATDTSYKFRFFNGDEEEDYQWKFIDSIYFCEKENAFVQLGTFNDSLINFARVSYGEGYFYLHTTPLTLTNYHLLEENGLAYTEGLFSHLQEGPIYWDAYSRVSEYLGLRQNQELGSSAPVDSESPLQYILSQRSLTWAWYLFLAMALLYLIFRAKRRQRIIPVLEENKNTSLQFISTIGSLYFIQNDHRKLSIQKMKLFDTFVRDRYHLPTKVHDREFVDRLADRSEVQRNIINRIVLFFNNIKTSNFVSEKTLIELHQAIDQFYKNCK